jgi:hypothetical protein
MAAILQEIPKEALETMATALYAESLNPFQKLLRSN